jgi:hypothetical protein
MHPANFTGIHVFRQPLLYRDPNLSPGPRSNHRRGLVSKPRSFLQAPTPAHGSSRSSASWTVGRSNFRFMVLISRQKRPLLGKKESMKRAIHPRDGSGKEFFRQPLGLCHPSSVSSQFICFAGLEIPFWRNRSIPFVPNSATIAQGKQGRFRQFFAHLAS